MHPFRSVSLVLIAAVALCGSVPHAVAERADRAKPLNVESDQDGQFDMLKQVVTFNGNVVMTKGTIVIRAAKVEVHEAPDGYRSAVAIGSAGHLATFRQKREGVDEVIEGQAERLEYDSKADTVRFVHSALVRRLRGNVPADQITGNEVTYDNVTEVFSVSGGGSSGAAAASGASGGRVRAVLTPAEGTDAAKDAARDAAAEAAASAASAGTGR